MSLFLRGQQLLVSKLSPRQCKGSPDFASLASIAQWYKGLPCLDGGRLGCAGWDGLLNARLRDVFVAYLPREWGTLPPWCYSSYMATEPSLSELTPQFSCSLPFKEEDPREVQLGHAGGDWPGSWAKTRKFTPHFEFEICSALEVVVTSCRLWKRRCAQVDSRTHEEKTWISMALPVLSLCLT